MIYTSSYSAVTNRCRCIPRRKLLVWKATSTSMEAQVLENLMKKQRIAYKSATICSFPPTFLLVGREYIKSYFEGWTASGKASKDFAERECIRTWLSLKWFGLYRPLSSGALQKASITIYVLQVPRDKIVLAETFTSSQRYNQDKNFIQALMYAS